MSLIRSPLAATFFSWVRQCAPTSRLGQSVRHDVTCNGAHGHPDVHPHVLDVCDLLGLLDWIVRQPSRVRCDLLHSPVGVFVLRAADLLPRFHLPFLPVCTMHGISPRFDTLPSEWFRRLHIGVQACPNSPGTTLQ